MIVSNLSFSERVAIIRCTGATRTEALNIALSSVQGRYVVIADQTDRLDPNWVSAFECAAKSEPAVLRVGRTSLSPEEISTDEQCLSTDNFGVFPLTVNVPKSISEFAIPGEVIRRLGLRLDPGITYGSEWALVIQAVLLCGLAVSSAIMVSGNETLSEESAAKARHEVLTQLNSSPLLLPPGAAQKIDRLAHDAAKMDRELRHAKLYQATLEENLSNRDRALGFLQKTPLLRDFLKNFVSEILSANSQTCNQSANWQTYVEQDGRAFLTIIIRTRGIEGVRIRTLREMLMTLAGQSCQDFELLLVVHSKAAAAYQRIGQLVGEFPSDLTNRVKILSCGRPGRAAPLNEALPHARGEYVAVLDDDDYVFGHWIETFKNLAKRKLGQAPARDMHAAKHRFDPP